ncbi:MAG: DUF1214 domain-containing protein [Jiangellales bacterium]
MPATDAPEVTITNYVRAESDIRMRGYIAQMDCSSCLVHSWALYDVHHEVTVRANRDTLRSFGVFDLTTPLTVHMPEPDGRYQSLMTVSQDHSIKAHDGQTLYTLTVGDVPCDALWSVTLYDADGWMPVNDFDAYSYNRVTADGDDGTVTIRVGGDSTQSNYLPIVPGGTTSSASTGPDPRPLTARDRSPTPNPPTEVA